jgi:hypothetical protein
MNLFIFFHIILLCLPNFNHCKKSPSMKFPPLPRQTVQCTCGKVQLVIESPSALRLVCYCKDCRGYYQTLNSNANAATNKVNPTSSSVATTFKNNAKLDHWGGLDGTQIVQGNEYLTKCLIREKSPIQRIYTTCCHTPICTIGPSGAAIVNTHLLQDPLPDVQFRIIGRQALLSSNAIDNNNNNKEPSPPPPPKMSWSVPLSWFWTMPGRIQKDKSSPAPLEGVKATVLENFQQG